MSYERRLDISLLLLIEWMMAFLVFIKMLKEGNYKSSFKIPLKKKIY